MSSSRGTNVFCGLSREQLVSRCLKTSQPQRIISGLRETFRERYIFKGPIDFHNEINIQRTNKAEIRPEKQSKKAEGWWENLWNEIQLKGP